jgi:hypothetical protein
MADPDYQYSDSESDFEVDLADSPRQKSPQQIRENMADIGRRRVTHLDGDDLAVLGTSIIDEGFTVNLLFRPDPSNPRRSLCTGRNCTYGGDMGATRQRAHILGIFNRDVRACKSAPTRVVWKGTDRKLDTMAVIQQLEDTYQRTREDKKRQLGIEAETQHEVRRHRLDSNGGAEEGQRHLAIRTTFERSAISGRRLTLKEAHEDLSRALITEGSAPYLARIALRWRYHGPRWWNACW